MGIAYNAKYNKPEWIGKKYNMLTVIGIEHKVTKSGYNEWWWKVKCDCGKEKSMKAVYVQSGHSKSCGCFRKSGGFMTNLRHNETHTRLHSIWSMMRERCGESNSANERYAGRGIKVCEDWQRYENFAKWARENGYDDTLSIERINNDGDYCPENCKWIPRNLQARNRGTTYWVEYQGRKMSLAEACEIADMPYKQVYARINYLNWPVEKALSIPMNTTRAWKRNERFCKNPNKK